MADRRSKIGILVFAVILVAFIYPFFRKDNTLKERLKEVTPADQAILQQTIEAYRTNDLKKLQPIMHESLNFNDVVSYGSQFRPYFDHGEITSQETSDIGLNTNFVGNDSSKTMRTLSIYQTLKFADGFETLFQVTTLAIGTASPKLGGARVYNASDIKQASRFDLSGKSITHYIFLSLAALNTLFVLFVTFRTWTTLKKRRLLWTVVSLVCVGVFSIDWSTGAFVFSPLNTLLFGSGFIAPHFQPLVISLGLPIGALLALYQLRKQSRA